MFSLRHSILFVLALGGIGLLAACEQPSTSDVDQTEEGVLRLGSVEAVDTVSRAVAPNDRPLVIDGFRGVIEIQGGSGKTAELRFVRRGRGEDVETARGVLEDVTISESGTQEAYTYTLETDGDAYAAVDVSGTVPERTELRLEQSTGPVSVRGVEGPLTVDREHGPVTIRGAAASVDIEIRNGDVDVHFSSLPADAEVSLRTANGDLTLRVPPAASAQISAQTSVGDIRTQGLALSAERFMPRDAGGRYTAQLGSGAASVDLRTENGSVFISAADTTVPEPPTEPSSPEEPAESLAVPPSDTTVLPPSPDTAGPAPVTPDTASADTTQF
jgi:hypothetical protein